MASLSVSIIITTYNWPQALSQVLEAIKLQYDNHPLEVIVADDGSTQETARLIHLIKASYPVPLYHVWQPDEGFQAAKIRNRAIAKASYDYIIFLDGDCVPLSGFLKNHRKLAERGCLVYGNRILLNKKLTSNILQSPHNMTHKNLFFWVKARFNGNINRLLPLLRLPLGFLRKKRPGKWQGVKTCNLAAWRSDLIAVNGLEEAYQGWGFEDTDLVIRLQKKGIKSKDGRFAIPVVHFWHPEQDKSASQANWQRVLNLQTSSIIQASKGINQYTATASSVEDTLI